ncbi:MAG: hypothetical protein M3282_05725 [Gemmatimonadota bacterium]|nr:hypothetical protein [Gemmatimonadota bacterium]
MPLDIWLDADEHLRHAVASGTLTDRDLLEAWGDALADPAYDPAADNLVDVSGAERFEVTPVGAQRLADIMAMCARPAPAGVRPRVACVAPSDDAFSVLRIYELCRERQGSPSRYFVCRTLEEARCWLGLPRIDGADPRPAVRVIDVPAARAAR